MILSTYEEQYRSKQAFYEFIKIDNPVKSSNKISRRKREVSTRKFAIKI